MLAATEGEERRVAVHGGGILAAAGDGKRVITGGDDGKVVATDRPVARQVLATDAKRRWIDHVAAGPDGVRRLVGGQARLRAAGARARCARSTCFRPSGARLCAQRLSPRHRPLQRRRRCGFPTRRRRPSCWSGRARISASCSARTAVPGHHHAGADAARLAPTSTASTCACPAIRRACVRWAWTADGEWLATSGSEQLILWPFAGKDGPMGKQPQHAGAAERPRHRGRLPSRSRGVVAVGFEDGLVLLVRIADGAEILAQRPGGAPVSALAWDAAGAGSRSAPRTARRAC